MCKLITVLTMLFVVSIGSVSASYDSEPRTPLILASDVDVVASSPSLAAALKKQQAKIEEIQRILDTDYAKYKNKPRDLAAYVYHAASLNNIPPRLLVNLMARESGFRPNARSKYGAIGIAQVIPRHWDTTASRMLDYRQAIHKSAEIISFYRERCGGLRCALHKYNVGEGNYRKGKRAPRYVAALMRNVHV